MLTRIIFESQVARSASVVRQTGRVLSTTSDVTSSGSGTAEPKPAFTEVPPKAKPQAKTKPLAWFYAVRKGREVGVFRGWDEVKGKILGFSGAVYKEFRSEERARKWLESDISAIDPKDLPTPPKKAEEKDTVYGSRYVLSFSTATSTSEDPLKKGLVGLGWILRKLPERTLVLAGCDLYDTKLWRESHPRRAGYEPQLPRELPLLESLNRGLDETSKAFKIVDTPKVSAKEGEAKEAQQVTKLPFPLHIQSDHVYTVGLLTGANPVLPELVEPLKAARNQIKLVAASHLIEEVPYKENTLAQGLAKAALARKNPKISMEGGRFLPTFNSLMAVINNTPDVPANVTPAQPPSARLSVNGEEVKSYGGAKKQTA